MTRLSSRGLALALALAAASCGDATTNQNAVLNLDRPVDIAFACFGGLRLVGDNGTADPADAVISSAQAMESCRLYALPDPERAPGQGPLDGETPVPIVDYFGFILQSVPGTVALAAFPAKDPADFLVTDVNVFDADPLTPGKNAIAVGDLPIAIAPDVSGCHMITANAGSCDLSVIDINSVVDSDPETRPDVRSIEVVNAAGDPVVARPAAMVGAPPTTAVGAACPADPAGLVWVAYPECHLVAAVQPGTGEIAAGVRFTDAGLVEITDGNVSCPAQCGGGGTLGPGERPVALDLFHDTRVGTRRMVIGADNSSFLTMVELDADGLPQSLSRVELEGGVGVVDVALSQQLGMGGSSGLLTDDSGPGGQYQFVYAVADDGTVRVAEFFNVNAECDTQVDPRYLRGNLTVVDQSCYAVGAIDTPPRRPLARGPGIELVDGTPITSVAIVTSDGDIDELVNPKTEMKESEFPNDDDDAPTVLIGTFAFVGGSTGEVDVVTIDDDNYSDQWLPAAPIDHFIPNIIAHQLRDAIPEREELAFTNGKADCSLRSSPATADGLLTGGPRLTDDDDVSPLDFVADMSMLYARPGFRRVECFDEEQEQTVDVYETAFAAPQDVRDATFPDLRAVRFDEVWRATWEGRLSDDDFTDNIDGPRERVGLIDVDGGMSLVDPARPFCAIGVEPYDWVEFTGCDSLVGDADCGLGLSCYVHPDAEIGFGQCLPTDLVAELAAPCRDFLLTNRRFGVVQTLAGELTLVPRRKVLELTPLDGCTSDTQCDQIALEQYRVDAIVAANTDGISENNNLQPGDINPSAEELGTYSCRVDPSRGRQTQARCVQTCDDDAECGAGSMCTNNECVEGVVPPAECVPGLQRYAVHGGEAYVVIGSKTGYLHRIIEDDAGACVVDDAANPLLVGRIPMTAPACSGDGFTDLAPNPCQVTVSHADRRPIYGATCPQSVEEQADVPRELVIEDVPAIRFRNPALTFHLVRPTYPGDAQCREDRGGSLVNVSYAREGHTMALTIDAGFVPLRSGVSPVFPINLVRGPEESVWVIDHGDNIPDSATDLNLRGQVFRADPANFTTLNVVR